MMYYTTSGKPKQISYGILDNVMFHIEEYFQISDLEINLEFKNFKGPTLGLCDHEDENEYTIEIKKSIPLDEIIRTIFHESVHVMQMHRGMFVPGSPPTWGGKIYDVSYYDLPWEKEAYEIEEMMMKTYKK